MNLGFDAKRIFHNTTGLGNYSRDLIQIISKFYPENSFRLYNPKKKRVDRLVLTDKVVEVLPKAKFWKKFSSIWRQGPIVKQLVEDEVEIFHGLSGEIPKGLRKNNVKSVVTIHDLIFVRFPKLYSFINRTIYFKKAKNAAHQSDVIIAISEQTKRDVVEFLKVDEAKVTVIYQGCHHTFKEEKSLEYKNEVIRKFKIPSDFILSVGTIIERKNLLTLVEAVKDLETPLVVVGGKTAYYKKVVAYIEEYQLQDKIFFLEGVNINELSAIYQIAQVFVYPSIFEGFGIPIVEALYSKTPVITSKGGCFDEAGGPDSIYIDSYDVVDLKEQLTLLLDNPLKRNQVAEKGYIFAQKFNDDQIAKNVMDVYQKLI
ncbi:MAG: glycosyltransferase family 4 protein [Flavobacteriaceae bacterium]